MLQLNLNFQVIKTHLVEWIIYFFPPNCWLIVHFGDPGFSIALGLMTFQCHHCNCYFYGLLSLLGAEIAFHMTLNLGLHAQSWTLEALSMGNSSCNDKNN